MGMLWRNNELISLAFAPLQFLLEAPDVVEICINEPHKVFVEYSSGATHAGMVPLTLPELTRERICFMAERVAADGHQFVNEEEPLLSASLPDGSRVQVILPPAAPGGGTIAIRRKVVRDLSLSDYVHAGSLLSVRLTGGADGLTDEERSLCNHLDSGDIAEFLHSALRLRISMIISGGTGTGKTTFLNALMREIPRHERVITIEDTPELLPPHSNHVRLIASRGNQNIAQVDMRRLVEASLRLRPDRLLLGEVRGGEALDFLQAINTGHPGSLSTVHANSPRSAYERLAMLVMQTSSGGGGGLSKTEIIDHLHATLPIVVQLGRKEGRPGAVSEIFYAPYVRQAVRPSVVNEGMFRSALSHRSRGAQ
ncbi:P-type DNA transfer ATPase VirB11 [Phyllobacterium myrsinacearum]|uniref:Type IV secretion system protein n=1 Tax=Phyllobacterium myrsinacearum TaxID=28101 RepID=A0A839ELL7_9HYPH|nr:P-type DNA transfer ATPase VirB11 [Phyllobacterium myrsinacearum]MBA8877387.1 type IV secretion system protein VirB11 [Phyllobacterium myrsinacearum]